MHEDKVRVFVYGTLRRGEANHHLLETRDFVGMAQSEACFTLVDLGAFPAMVPGGGTAVVGEVYEVGPVTLAALDRLEGHPRFYQRHTIQLADGSTALAYLLSPEQSIGKASLSSGDWLEAQGSRRRKRCG